MYILFAEYVGYYGFARLVGSVASPDDFAILFGTDPTVFFLLGRFTAMLFGLGGVYLAYRVARNLAGRWAGVGAALFLAATFAHNVSSKEVKADLPCAFFTILAFLFLLRVLRDGSWKYALLAGAAAGCGMGTKYYSIFLLVPMGLAAFLNALQDRPGASGSGAGPVIARALSRYGMFLFMVGVFFLFFFLSSPFNYLDPLWYDLNLRPMLQHRFRMLGPAKVFVKVFHLLLGGEFSRGGIGVTALAVGIGGALFTGLVVLTRRLLRPAAAHRGWAYAVTAVLIGLGGILAVVAPHFTENFSVFASVLFTPESMGTALAVACVLGGAVLLVRGSPGDLLLLVSGISFTIIANFYQPLYAEARHLHPLYPFLAVAGAAGGAVALRALARLPGLRGPAGGRPGRRTIAAVAAVAALALALPGVVRSIGWNVIQGRADTRTLALRWFEENVPAGAYVLNDKEAIKIRTDESAVRRKMDLLEEELRKEGVGPFTKHKGRLYEMQLAVARKLREQGEPTYRVRVLDPPWWAEREREGGEYLTPLDRDIGDPLAERIPRTLDEYRDEGIEYLVTSSQTYRMYTSEPWKSNWPSFDRFYREIFELEPVREFPAEPGVRPGPTVRIYRIR
jgi:hypothetical protein